MFLTLNKIKIDFTNVYIFPGPRLETNNNIYLRRRDMSAVVSLMN